ncbi:hypothetical protein DWX88_19395, partial [Bacteroides xylanisolvens]
KRKQELEKLKYGTILSQEITDSDDIQSSANKENEVPIQKRKQELEKLKYGTILSQEITDSDDIQSSANKENEVPPNMHIIIYKKFTMNFMN